MKYFIFTYGCQMNEADSEKIATVLEKTGHKPAKNAEQADLIVINACSVRQSAVDRAYAKVNKFYKAKKIILAGCILESDKKKLKDKVAEFWHPDKYFGSLPCYQSKATAYVPIMTGCNNFCSYCVVPYTRGHERSRPAQKIIKEVKSLIKKGYKEIVLIGQNVNSYQGEIAHESVRQWNSARKTAPTLRRRRSPANPVTFPDLLKLLNNLPGNFQLSFLTSHPKDMSDELIETIARCQKVAAYIHLPVQSGDNQILRKMNRHYTAAHYKNLIKKIRAAFKKYRPDSPKVEISTDIIVGFPGETKKQFQNTVKLCKQIKFDKAYIAKYSPRPGTAAAKLKDNISAREKKRRWRILENLINKPG